MKKCSNIARFLVQLSGDSAGTSEPIKRHIPLELGKYRLTGVKLELKI